jgi:hypothetical protein
LSGSGLKQLAVVALSLSVLAAAGCGSTKPSKHKPQVSPAASALATFRAQDCGQCHIFAPAKSTGTIGPNLNHLKAAAKADDLPLGQFVSQEITDPDTYVAPGTVAGVMPANYESSIPPAKLTALIKFLVAHTN